MTTKRYAILYYINFAFSSKLTLVLKDKLTLLRVLC